MLDVIIVGTGPCGVAAALGLAEKKVLLLDAVWKPEAERDAKGSIKYFPIEANNFSIYISRAWGGLANAWKARLYPYTDYELQNFPIKSAELKPHYGELTRHIGSSDKNDDLLPLPGNAQHLQREINPCLNIRHLEKCYKKRKKGLNKAGIYMSCGRTAVLSEAKEAGQAASIYTPTITLDYLKKNSNFTFKDNHLVESFKDTKEFVAVSARNLNSSRSVQYKAKKLILAAGALGTGRIVLASFKDYQTRLPILDNPASLVPFINLRAVGAVLDQPGCESAALDFVYDGPLFPERVAGVVSGYISPRRGDIFFNLPLAVRGNLSLVRYLVPALVVIQLFYPDSTKEDNYIQLHKDNTLFINYTDTLKRGDIERLLIKSFRYMGFFSTPSQVRYPQPGYSRLCAGTIPMGQRKRKYHLTRDNRLNNTTNVYVVDGSWLPELPAQNFTFTLMANALRAARIIKKKL